MNNWEKLNILFYDGECGFCNRSVQLVLDYQNKSEKIYFLQLQSESANEFLSKKGISINMDTLYYFDGNKIYSKSSAVLKISKHLKGIYRLLGLLIIIPKFIRDWGYSKIAKYRKKIIKNPSCRLPTIEERKLFLD